MTGPALLGMLILDREPYTFRDLPGLFQAWLQDAGGFATLGLVGYLIYAFSLASARRGKSDATVRARAGVNGWMIAMALCSILCSAVYLVMVLQDKGVDTVNSQAKYMTSTSSFVKYEAPKFSRKGQPIALMLSGAFSLLAIGQPFVAGLMRLRTRRLGAIARLSLLEVWRMRLLWVYALFLLPVLFPVNWYYKGKPEDELRLVIDFSSIFMQLLVLLSAGVLASFALPSDIKNQNIYTVVTKPVERFEIILGRFFGYFTVMTAVLLAMSLVGWGMIRITGVDQAAVEETLKARVPIRGAIEFKSRNDRFSGTHVGREFDYRRYIVGDPTSLHRAIWSFDRLPSGFPSAGVDHAECEFTFDIYRMTKGEENRGVDLSIRIVTWQCPQKVPVGKQYDWPWEDDNKRNDYENEAKAELAKVRGVKPQNIQNPIAELSLAKPGTPEWGIADRLAEKFGFYEIQSKEIFDYHPERISIPAGIFRNARMPQPPVTDEPGKRKAPPQLKIYVKCNTKSQLVGMAETDLFILREERTFDENYFRAAFGLWCRIGIVVGLAVSLSTSYSGVVTFLMTAALFCSGFFTSHIAEVASGKGYYGGPMKNVRQLMNADPVSKEYGTDSSVDSAINVMDSSFSWIVRRYINVVPDIESFTWTHFLAEGFNVPTECLVMNVLVMIAYLAPWLVLGFYLLRSREVAA